LEKEDEDSDGEPEKSESWHKMKSTNEAMVEGGDQDDTLGHGSRCWEAAQQKVWIVRLSGGKSC